MPELRIPCNNCDCIFTLVEYSGQKLTLCVFCGQVVVLPLGSPEALLSSQPQAERPPRSLSFQAAQPYGDIDAIGLVETLNDGLAPPVGAFLANITRLRFMLDLPAQAIFLVRAADESLNEALKQTGKDESERDSPDVQAIRHQLMVEQLITRKDYERFGIEGFQVAAMLGGQYIWQALDAVLTAQITGVWTAFEVLAGDLWEAAVNSHPEGLADLSGGKAVPPLGSKETREERRKDDDREDRLPSGRIAVNRTWLQEHRYKIDDRWGTVLREERDFQRLEGIREAYALAFAKHDPIIHILFDPALRRLSLLRNLIVHRGGIVDREHRDKEKRYLGGSSIEVNKRVPITGPLVHSLVKDAIEVAIRLIRIAD